MKKTVTISEPDLHNLIMETISEYTDNGTFTTIGTPGAQLTRENPTDDDVEKLLTCLNSIANKTYTEAQYLKTTCNVQNPMFIRNIQDRTKRLIATRAWQTYEKLFQLYQTVKSSIDEIEKLK